MEGEQQRNEEKKVNQNGPKTQKELGRKNQVDTTRIRPRYTIATHSYIMEKRGNTACPFCNTKLTVEHILWTCKETEKDQI
jgi:hypothetical protein